MAEVRAEQAILRAERKAARAKGTSELKRRADMATKAAKQFAESTARRAFISYMVRCDVAQTHVKAGQAKAMKGMKAGSVSKSMKARKQ